MLGERRGQGLGTEATRLALDWAFTVLGLHNVDLRVFAWNRAAVRCYEKAGFRRAGLLRGGAVCLGRRFDVVIMDAIAEEFTGSVLAAMVPE
jgi:diamine N-acetyltransferase